MGQAAEAKLIETMSPHEQMDFSGLQHYFQVGRSAIECIYDGLRAAGKQTVETAPFDVKTILDLPCGQGRVLRYLRQAFPDAEITACETSREGVDFCAETFGAVPVYSCDEPDKIPIRRDYYDLIWVGSLFTHLTFDMWDRFLAAFRSALSPGGVLIFTTHGRRAYEYMSTKAFHYGHDDHGLEELARLYEQVGFGHVHYTGHNSYYGTSISRADWVLDRIRVVGGLRLVKHAEHGWDNHQDVYTCLREG
jgi:SAM-dependent methyltransferase